MRLRRATCLVFALAVVAATFVRPSAAYASLTSVHVRDVTTSSARVVIWRSSSGQRTIYYRYGSSGTLSITSSLQNVVFTISGLTSGTNYTLEVSLQSNFGNSQSASFTTLSGASLSSVSASEVTGVSATATVTLTNPDTLPVSVYLRYKHSDEGAWSTTSVNTYGTSVTFSLAGLDYGRDYEVQVSLSGSYTNTSSITVTTDLILPECSAANSPLVDLGEIGIAAGSELTHQGSVPGTVAAASCVDSASRTGVLFTFSVASGEEGAVSVEARRSTSTMVPELLVRSGDAYTGSALFQDTRAGALDALAAGLVDAGTYTLQLRSGARLSDSDVQAGGPYSVTVTRLQPRLVSAFSDPTTVTTVWDVGATTSTDSGNAVELTVQIEYREDSEQTWTSVAASLSPPEGQESVTDTVTGLDFGSAYYVRAAYTNAAEYVESDGILTRARILLSGAPYGVEATAHVVDVATRKYQVRAAWETPEIVADDNTDWGYAIRLDGGVAYFNEAGREHVQETVFLYGADAVRGGVLAIEVNNSFECLEPAESEANSWTTCSLNYNQRDYILPLGAYWSTPWSAPALVRIADHGFTAGTTGTDKDPDQAVTETMDVFLGVAGLGEEDRPSQALSVLLCSGLALGAGVGLALKAGGMKLAPVLLGTGVGYTIWGGLGPVIFGVPGGLVAVTAALPVVGGGLALMNRFLPFLPMVSRVIVVLLLVHFATMLGHIMAGAEPAVCAGSSDVLCGTPLEGIFGRAESTEVSANPFKFLGSVLTLMSVLKGFTWYDYELLSSSGNVVVVLWVWGVRAVFMGVALWLLWQGLGIIAQAMGRFFGR